MVLMFAYGASKANTRWTILAKSFRLFIWMFITTLVTALASSFHFYIIIYYLNDIKILKYSIRLIILLLKIIFSTIIYSFIILIMFIICSIVIFITSERINIVLKIFMMVWQEFHIINSIKELIELHNS